jgi:hypothetical protein
MPQIKTEILERIQEFFNRQACRDGVRPLKEKIEIAIYVGSDGPGTLLKESGGVKVLPTAPGKADLTFWVTEKAVDKLLAAETNSVGDVGIAILQLMASSDADCKIKAKVHVGIFDMLRKGYLGVIPLGGPAVMKYLGSKGFGSIGKIKDAISQMKSDK